MREDFERELRRVVELVESPAPEAARELRALTTWWAAQHYLAQRPPLGSLFRPAYRLRLRLLRVAVLLDEHLLSPVAWRLFDAGDAIWRTWQRLRGRR